jgi:hypothetical protein
MLQKLGLLFLIIISNTAIGQSPALSVSDNLNNFVNTAKVAETSGYGQSGRIYMESYSHADQKLGKSYSYADLDLSGESYASVNSSGYNPNNQAHTNNPKLTYIYTHFEARRLNGYYRDLETWRKSEKSRLKREGILDREAIEYLYSLR